MPHAFRCKYCLTKIRTAQGIQSHISQSLECRRLQEASLDGEISTRAAESLTALDMHAADLKPLSDDDASSVVDFDMPIIQSDPLLASPASPAPPSKRARVTIEDVVDEDDIVSENARWIEAFPGGRAGEIYDTHYTRFSEHRMGQQGRNEEPWAPFQSQEEWELSEWLMKSGISQKKTDSFLKLKIIKDQVKPSFHNNRAFLKHIDALPCGPKWECEFIEVTGDRKTDNGEYMTEELELWHRNPVSCIEELLGNSQFRDKTRYAPERVYTGGDGHNRVIDEAWTADWWWKAQEALPAGATVGSLIVASDKTQLSRFSGDKSAWPVYGTIGNIEKATRRCPTERATVLLGYIPVTKLECFKKSKRSLEGGRLFHECMRKILEPLVKAGKEGVKMVCADGGVRLVFPLLAAYMADHPEQCLIACCKESRCPRCLVSDHQRGEPVHSVLRDPEKTLSTLEEQLRGEEPEAFEAEGLKAIHPFWSDLPHCNFFECITPDILHQLHKGVFKDHIVKWSTECMNGGASEIDRRFQAMTSYPGLRHFNKGISLVSQWTGTEYKNMEKIYLGILAGASDPAVLRAVRGVLDFIYFAHFESHTDESLALLDAAWVSFHNNKHVFEDLKIRQHFNIAKIHAMKHYLDAIRTHGTADGYNTESPERLHIDFAKVAYLATNRKAYIQQMTTWLRRQEAVHTNALYLQWAVPGYICQLDGRGEDAEDTEIDDEAAFKAQGDKDDEDGSVDGETDIDRDQALPSPASTSQPYTIAKRPSYPRTPVTSIVSDFGAIDFVPHLQDFLRRESLLTAAFDTINVQFSLFKRISIPLPAAREVTRTLVKDTIRATKSEPAKNHRKATTAHFDTVLAREKPKPARVNGPLDGLCVARVRVIFTLPEEYGHYEHPLAYVEWYKPLREPVADIEMYKVSLSTHMRRTRASVIPITQIDRSCFLLPSFKLLVNPSWTADRVLDQCTEFFLNTYTTHHDFFLFRYLVPMHSRRIAAATATTATARR